MMYTVTWNHKNKELSEKVVELMLRNYADFTYVRTENIDDPAPLISYDGWTVPRDYEQVYKWFNSGKPEWLPKDPK